MKHKSPEEPNLFCFAALAYARQWIKEMHTDEKEPKETPPNRFAAAVKPVQAIPLKSPPWNEWLRLARQGDENAKLCFCTQAESFIKALCSADYFSEKLGRDETRSIATLAVVEFMMNYPDPPPDEKMPFMLKKVIRTSILARIKKVDVRLRREQKPTAAPDGDSAEKKENCIESFPASSAYEPEYRLFQKELDASFRQLRPNEQAVLDAYYFQDKTVSMIAAELHRSRQFVERIHKRALRRLREMLEGTGASGCCPAT